MLATHTCIQQAWQKTKNISPASGGPIVMGTEKILNIHPRACDAPSSPTRSKAIGPKRQMNSPSHRPISRHITTKVVKVPANGMHKEVMPRKNNAACCRRTRLTQRTSASRPNTILATPDVMPMNMGSRFPLDAGKTSFVCWTWLQHNVMYMCACGDVLEGIGVM